MNAVRQNGEDVGKILLKVQDDLRQLRAKMVTSDGIINVSDLDEALKRTEDGIQQHTEDVTNRLNNQVQMLPVSSGQDNQMMVFENMTEIPTHNQIPSYALNRKVLNRQPLPAGITLSSIKSSQVQGPSPGQRHYEQLTMKALSNPHNQYNRMMMKENFGIQLPLINDRKPTKQIQKPIKGTMVEHLTVLPKENRVDATLTPPPIEENDTRLGILSLLERGLIPPSAKLTLDPSPVKKKMAKLHDFNEKNKRVYSESASDKSVLKLDIIEKEGGKESRINSSHTREHSAGSKKNSSRTPASSKTFEMQLQPFPPPTTPASGEIKQTVHRFVIQNGRTRETQQDFLSFKQHYCLAWGSIVSMIRNLERMLSSYAVPIAFIHGDKLADLSVEFELEKEPEIGDMLGVIINREDVEAIINKPGRRFVGTNGLHVAATKIQSSWKRYKERSKYLEYRRLKWAAGVIAISWIMHIKMAKMRSQLKQTRLDQLNAFKKRSKVFSSSWDRIKNSRRVIIHIPSLGLSQPVRDGANDLGIRQNTQMARLCDIRDPNVDVILISAVPLSDETLQYYSKLLGLSSAVSTGNPEDQTDMTGRYKIIVPEAIKSFPTHHMCLSTILKYSPRTLKRIKHLIKGKESYIVTGMSHWDDLAIADLLDVPILGPEPEVAHLYSTKSGSKRIFASANVDSPPSEYDVYSLGQLHECLAQLVTENLAVTRWLFKLDDEFNGRGIAYCDVAKYLKCYKWALKEERRYGEKWSKKWAQEAAYIKIHAEVPDILMNYAEPVNKKLFSTWEKFLIAFLAQGGVIEACPPSENITAISTDILIEPSGSLKIICCGDQIHAESPFSCWGISTPQSSIDPSTLNVTCNRVAEACKSRGIVGYVRLDFVTFIDPRTSSQRLWAIDLCIHYSDNLAMFTLMEYVTQGKFLPETHSFEVSTPADNQNKTLKATEDEKKLTSTRNRFAVMSTKLMHSNLAVVHYSVYFQMCRAHGIGYDIKDKTGTCFTLIDSFNRERLGMITVGNNLQGALASFAHNLSVIHQEISAPNMQGTTNFKAAIADIENILGTTIQNAEDHDNRTD